VTKLDAITAICDEEFYSYNYMLENCAHCVHAGQSVANWRLYA